VVMVVMVVDMDMVSPMVEARVMLVCMRRPLML